MALNKIIFCLLLIVAASCNNSQTKGDQLKDSVGYFPLESFLVQQINSLDSAGSMIIERNSGNNKMTSQITTAEAKTLALTFLELDDFSSSNKKYFSQNIFMDNTTASYTFNYTSSLNELAVKNIDILLDTQTNNVKRVFINKSFSINDSAIIERLSWKNNESFSITRLTNYKNEPARIEQSTVKWNNN